MMMAVPEQFPIPAVLSVKSLLEIQSLRPPGLILLPLTNPYL